MLIYENFFKKLRVREFIQILNNFLYYKNYIHNYYLKNEKSFHLDIIEIFLITLNLK
jgi:hypothetical protein